jgi:hypothetical protein
VNLDFFLKDIVKKKAVQLMAGAIEEEELIDALSAIKSLTGILISCL